MSLKIAKTRCDSCIFGSASAIKGRPERMRDLQRQWRSKDTHQVCHAFGVGGDEDDELVGENVVCRGFYETEYEKNGTGQMIRIAERLNCIEFVDQPREKTEDPIV